MCFNARSIVNKVPDLLQLVDEVKPSIVCISETWLHNGINSACLGLRGFTIFRKDRDNGNNPHGGVLIAVKSELNPVIQDHRSNAEILLVNMFINNVSFKIVNAYRSTALNSEQNVEFVDFLRMKLSHHNNYILLGDLNYPNIDWQHISSGFPMESYFLDFFIENNLIQYIHEPTRGQNILDLCIGPPNVSISNVEIHEEFSTSDHSYFTFDLGVGHRVSEDLSLRPDFHRADWDAITSYLASIDWENLLIGTCEECWADFKEIIHFLSENYVPKYRPNVGLNAPWSNNHIMRISRTKKTGSPHLPVAWSGSCVS